MLVLFLAVLLLVAVPAMLLIVGRTIYTVTDGRRNRPAAVPGPSQEAEDAWYRRGMLPAFYRVQEKAAEAQPLS